MPVELWEFIQRDAERQGVTPNDIVKQALRTMGEERKLLKVTFSHGISERIRKLCEAALMDPHAFVEDHVATYLRHIYDGQFGEHIAMGESYDTPEKAITRAQEAQRWDESTTPWLVIRDDEGLYDITNIDADVQRLIRFGGTVTGIVDAKGVYRQPATLHARILNGLDWKEVA